jgi:2,4-dienoyl-CoA reductase-like NADH-dependent reductase (Old Yellow Enzyme family)
MANPLLFQSFALRGLEVRNRLWVAPMCQYSALAENGPDQGVPGDWHVQHLGSLGRGGAGLVMVEATAVVPEGRISPGCLGLYTDEQEAAFARILPLVKAHGARVGIQLNHAGRKASTYRALPGQPSGSVPIAEGGWSTVAPSALAFEGLAEPRELAPDEIDGVREAFLAAARRAVRAGFDAVEFHAAHGYLLHEFLSPLSNRRTDDYGGTPENRARLLREIVCELRAEHPSLPILVRISGDEWVEGGFDPDDTAQVAAWLSEDGADLIDCSSGANVPADIPIGPSYQVHVSARVREAGLPVGVAGLITSAAQAEGILVTGQADVITLGRPLLADPHLPIAWAHELRAENAASFVPPQYARARF